MPIAEYFERYPAFPDDVPIAPLANISLRKLIFKDVEESLKLFEACKEDGIFLLDLKECNAGEVLLQDAKNLFTINEKLFALGQEELRKHPVNMPTNRFGYKFDSEFAHQVAEPDAIDIYTLSQDHVLGTTPSRSNPPLLDSYRPSVKQFIHDSYSVITVIFDHLDERLALPGGTLASFNRLDQPSGTGIRLLRTSAETVGTQRTRLFSHTDIGSITLLFNVLGGLQVLQTGYENTPDSAGWGYVKPQPDHIIVNIGDSISQWTGGLLKGNRHRVTTPPGQQATCTRYSVGYLIRPALDAPMKRLESPVIPSLQEGEKEETRCAKEWESSKGKKVVTSQPQVIDPPITSEIENGVKLSPPIAV